MILLYPGYFISGFYCIFKKVSPAKVRAWVSRPRRKARDSQQGNRPQVFMNIFSPNLKKERERERGGAMLFSGALFNFVKSIRRRKEWNGEKEIVC